MATIPVPQETADAIQLMSIHKSKGLEFPIVILANLDKRFNAEDIRQPLILDNHYGLCWTLQLPGTSQTYPSLPRWLGKKTTRKTHRRRSPPGVDVNPENVEYCRRQGLRCRSPQIRRQLAPRREAIICVPSRRLRRRMPSKPMSNQRTQNRTQ